MPITPPKAPLNTDSHQRNPAQLPGIDLDQFRSWAQRELPGNPALQSVSTLSGGHSNLNFLLDFGEQRYVLRRPPLGHVMESAHNMGREYRALRALSATSVPTPRTIALSPEPDPKTGIDAPFFVMEFVPAVALSSRADNAGHSPKALSEVSHNLVTSLATLHSVDPSSIGLEGFGKAEGYLGRQVRRWAKQLEASRSRDTPELDRLIHSLPDAPESTRASIVHGDFKMNNALIDFSGEHARVAAILDWELATLGDPYADLAMFGTYWEMPLADQAILDGFESPVDHSAGYPDFADLLGTYERASGIALPDMGWYRAFAAMKISVITESLHYRYHIGAAQGSGFELMAAMTEPIARIGLTALSH